MGQVKEILYEKLIDPVADRNCNRIRVHRAPNDEITIHFRNLKIVLHTKEEQEEWKRGFAEALQKFEEKGYMKEDI